MKIICYTPHYNEKHRRILQAFADGCGADVRDQRDYIDCDIAVIFGWYKYAFPPTMAKRDIIRRHWGRRLVVIESAFVCRGQYYQVGFNSFAGYADFNTRDRQLPLDRWLQMWGEVQPWRPFNATAPVVVMGQLPRDTQVQDVDHIAWCRQTVDRYRDYGLPVAFRPHPRCDNPDIYGIPYELYTKGKLPKVFDNARCVVTWNSTSAVDAVLAGVPVITCDRGSIAWPVAAHHVEHVGEDQLVRPDRHQWLANLGYSQWTIDEIQRGLAWNHLTKEPSQSPSSVPVRALNTN